MSGALFARLDRAGDVVLAGPAVRALAHTHGPVTFLAGPAGAAAARLLPGVASVIELDAPWVSFDPPDVDRSVIDALVDRIRDAAFDEALIATSWHQSPLPLALLLRLAGVPRIAGVGIDYPGALLDVRVPYEPELHEVEQSLLVASLAGHRLPAGDDGRLRLELDDAPPLEAPYVVMHPGASVPARALPLAGARDAVARLAGDGWRVIVTGTSGERAVAAAVAAGTGDRVLDAAGDTTFGEYATLLAGAAAVVCGNTAAAHVAAAVGTPVVEAFAPVVPAHRWRPWQVPHCLLGTVDIACRDCRARECPLPDQPCLAPFTGAAVAREVRRLAGRPDAAAVA